MHWQVRGSVTGAVHWQVRGSVTGAVAAVADALLVRRSLYRCRRGPQPHSIAWQFQPEAHCSPNTHTHI